MAADFVVRVGFPTLFKGEGVLESPHYEYPVTLKLPGYAVEKTFNRRYTDFYQLRAQLGARYWFCVIPPIPKKESVQGTLSKNISHISGNDENSELAEFRRTFLARFLKRLLSHPLLGKDELVIETFPDDQLWRQRLRDPIVAPHYLAPTIKDGIASALFSSRSTSSVGVGNEGTEGRSVAAEAYTRALTTDRLGDVDWALAATYLTQVRSGFKLLKNRVQDLSARRKQTGAALLSFGDAFSAVGNAGEDADLAKAISEFCEKTHKISAVYDKHQADEAKIVNILSYHVGMYAAACEMLRNASCAVNHVQQLGKTLADLKVSLTRTAPASQEPIRARIIQVELDKQQMEADMKKAEKTIQDELVSFHNTTQSDLKELLVEFAKIQSSSADAMKRDWEELRPMVEQLAAA